MDSAAIQSVVFDAVGTLIYPNPGVAQVYTAVGRRFGSKLAESEVAVRFRAALAHDLAGGLQTDEAAEYTRWRHIVRQVLDDVSDEAGCFAELWGHFARPSSWAVFPDVPATLAALAASGLHLAIASNFDLRLIKIAREMEGIRICQPVLVSSQIGHRKPHPLFFDAVRTTLAVPPSSILYVGDEPDNDIAAARSAGFQTLLVQRHGATGLGEAASLVSLLELVVSLESDSGAA